MKIDISVVPNKIIIESSKSTETNLSTEHGEFGNLENCRSLKEDKDY